VNFGEAIERLVDRMEVSSPCARSCTAGGGAVDRARANGSGTRSAELRVAEATTLLAIPVLERARAAYPGRMLVIKGPEIAARYPLPLRWFGDLDVLVDDGPAAFGALIGAGFEPIEVGREETRAHHFPPIWWPGMPLPIEIHTGVNWPRQLTAPPIDEIFATAVRSTLPLDGLETAAPEQHALLTAAHVWRHVPLRSVRDLLDVRLLADEADAAELERVARRWDLTRIWRTTDAAAAWLFEGGKRPFATRVRAQSL
jgi:putative nucleotidyltransferase-like protein